MVWSKRHRPLPLWTTSLRHGQRSTDNEPTERRIWWPRSTWGRRTHSITNIQPLRRKMGIRLCFLTPWPEIQAPGKRSSAPGSEKPDTGPWSTIWAIDIAGAGDHWSLDYASVPQVATVVSTIPIFVGLANLWLNKQPFTGAKILTCSP